ncbi:MAG: class I SAM-dependent methyltransferase [Ignavibacteriae bacterium]|nr:class I SAM-dependent methyltransferase [Ignavibacteriota bacterium]
MSDYSIYENEKLYNIWIANKNTKLYKNEMLRNNQLFEIIKKQNGVKNIIDIGCGTGYLDYLLSKNGKEITAVDLSKNSLDMFKEIANQFTITQVHENLFNINLKNFDMVISQEVLEHIEDYESAIAKMNLFIREDGIGLFCVPYNENLNAKMIDDPLTGNRIHKVGHLHSFTKEKLERSVEKSGFKLVETFLIVNKRSNKLFSNFKIPINNFTLFIDKIMNLLFPYKAAYLAVLCKK